MSSKEIKMDPRDPNANVVRTQSGDVLYRIATGDQIANIQRTARGLKHDRQVEQLQADLADAETRAALNGSFADVRVTKGVSAASVHSNTYLSNLSAGYANDSYIGERLILPVPVQKRSDIFAVYPQREMFESPTDLITNDRAQANEISASRQSTTYTLKDYGLQNFVSNETLDNQDLPFDERADMVMELAEHIARKREIRDAAFLTSTANYGSGNSVTLSGSDQWDSAGGGDPIKDITTAKAALFNGPGATDVLGFCSINVLNVLARHPTLLDLQKYTTNGLLTPEGIARYFGLAGLLVGEARKQTANEGQTASYSRIWGLDFGLVRVARAPSRRTASFAARFRKASDPVVTEWFDATAGKSGGYYVKNAVSEDIVSVASFGGYIIKSATAA